uniref:Chromosome 5 open reading frame 34 n=1 Tax=Catagonus wagneri TaxID=51154 RepID=A0A8C3VPX9_9CETA
MAAEVQMVLYEDDSVQVQYIDGSRLQLSPCGSEFLFEKAPPISAHPLEQPERIRQRTHFVISTYREQLQRALDFRNSFATCPFLSESLIPSERKKCIFIDITEVRWPGLDTDDSMICMQSGTVRISSLDGHAYLCLPKSQHEFTVHFLCKVSQKPDSLVVLSEKNNQAQKDKLVEKAGKIYACGSVSGQRLKNKENELYYQIMKSRDPLAKKSCINGTEGRKGLASPGARHTSVYTWVKQSCSVDSCPEEWKYPLSLALRFQNKISNMSGIDADVTQERILTSDISKKREREVSVLPRALLLSCAVPHLHRWNFCDSLSQRQFGEEEYSYPELVKVVWYKGITYRLTHKNMNSIEIYPGDGSVFKSGGANLGNYFTYYSIREGSEEREEKTYSVNNLPPDRPGSLFSVCSLIKQATRILQHCAKMRLSLSHNYRICCWKMAPGINDSNILPLLLRESVIPSVGRFLAYSDDKVHAIFLDGITLTLNWNFSSFIEERQVNRGLSLGWCKLTFPDGQDHLIQIQHPGPYERYVTTVISWCRRLTQTSQREIPTHPSPSFPEENWSVASELEKIQKFNLLLENSGVLNPISNKNEQSSDHYKTKSSEISLKEVNEKSVSLALKKTSEILQDIDCLLENSKR